MSVFTHPSSIGQYRMSTLLTRRLLSVSKLLLVIYDYNLCVLGFLTPNFSDEGHLSRKNARNPPIVAYLPLSGMLTSTLKLKLELT
jgi:hypothetical protein